MSKEELDAYENSDFHLQVKQFQTDRNFIFDDILSHKVAMRILSDLAAKYSHLNVSLLPVEMENEY